MIQHQTIEEAVAQILQVLGEDPQRQGLRDTPRRVAELYTELFSGLHQDPAAELSVTYDEEFRGLVLLRDIRFYSMCEHHLLPFFGSAYIGYLPNGKVAGTSKLVRAMEIVAHRPQLQERLTRQVAEALLDAIRPEGVAVLVSAEHLCMTMRGVRKPGTRVLTTAIRGSFQDGNTSKEQLMALVQGR